MIIPKDFIDAAPPLLLKIINTIDKTSLYSQPQLALSASLGLLSILKAHRVRSETNLRTNILNIGLLSPGRGKGHGLKVVKRVLEAMGKGYCVAGVPGSDSALLRALAETRKKLILWDEIGKDLGTMTSIKAPRFKADILTIIMSTFSAADTVYTGAEYANGDGKRPRKDIIEPCLSIVGISTASRFYEALNGSYISDGFLPRLLIFEGDESARTSPEDFIRSATASHERAYQALAKDLLSFFPEGKLSRLQSNEKPIKVVKFAGKSEKILVKVFKYFEKKKEEAPNEEQQSIYYRAFEHYIKLCLIVEESDSIISPDTAEWVFKLVHYLIQTSLEIVEGKIYNSPYEKHRKQVEDAIREAGTMTKAQITRACRKIRMKEREEIIKDLVESEVIEYHREITGEKTRKTTAFYKISSPKKINSLSN